MVKHLPLMTISTISLPEIKIIDEERLIREAIDGSKNKSSEDWFLILRSKKKRKLSNAALDKIDNTPSSDLISRLPDDVLCYILSNLSMRETMCTSILSKRWRHLWRHTPLKNLCFDVMNMTLIKRKQIDNDAFVKFVNQFLALHCGTTIESFRVECALQPIEKYIQDIDKWIEFAANKNVRKLDISLSTHLWAEKNYNYENIFPYWLFDNQGRGSALRHLTLTLFPLHLPLKFSHWSSLVSLTLNCVYITQENLNNTLSSCLSLQWLSMTRCSYSGKLKFASGLKLKHLNITRFYHLEKIDIRDLENLMSFEFSGHGLFEILCNKTAPVTRVCCNAFDGAIEWFDANREFEKKFPRLETLLLSIDPLKVRDVPNLPTLTNLKHLVCLMGFRTSGEGSMLEPINSFLKASPVLQTFELHLPRRFTFLKNKMTTNMREICSDSYRHENLKEVKMYNFYGEKEELELIEYLVRHFVSLELIQLDRKHLNYTGNGEWELNTFKGSKIKRKAALEMLRKIIPRSTRLIIL